MHLHSFTPGTPTYPHTRSAAKSIPCFHDPWLDCTSDDNTHTSSHLLDRLVEVTPHTHTSVPNSRTQLKNTTSTTQLKNTTSTTQLKNTTQEHGINHTTQDHNIAHRQSRFRTRESRGRGDSALVCPPGDGAVTDVDRRRRGQWSAICGRPQHTGLVYSDLQLCVSACVFE